MPPSAATELEDLADVYPTLQKMGVEVFSVSTDTHFSHKAWHDTSPAIGKIRYTMIGETHRVATVVAMGWRVRPLCLPTECGDKKIVSMEVAIDEDTLPTMRRRFGIHHRVLAMSAGVTAS